MRRHGRLARSGAATPEAQRCGGLATWATRHQGGKLRERHGDLGARGTSRPFPGISPPTSRRGGGDASLVRVDDDEGAMR